MQSTFKYTVVPSSILGFRLAKDCLLFSSTSLLFLGRTWEIDQMWKCNTRNGNPSGLQVISVTFSDPAFQPEMTATPLVWHDWLSNTGIQNRNKHSIRCMQAERSMAMSSIMGQAVRRDRCYWSSGLTTKWYEYIGILFTIHNSWTIMRESALLNWFWLML